LFKLGIGFFLIQEKEGQEGGARGDFSGKKGDKRGGKRKAGHDSRPSFETKKARPPLPSQLHTTADDTVNNLPPPQEKPAPANSLAALGDYSSSSSEDEIESEERAQQGPTAITVNDHLVGNVDIESEDSESEADQEQGQAPEADKIEESSSSSRQNPRQRKAKFCKYFAKGRCQQGDNCKFAHVKVTLSYSLFSFVSFPSTLFEYFRSIPSSRLLLARKRAQPKRLHS